MSKNMRYRFLRFPGGKPKAVTFSYDDGVKQDIRLADLMTKHGLKCTFNLNSEALKRGSGLSKDEVENKLLACGHEIAVHGYFHRGEGSVRPIEGIRDVLDMRLELEQKYNRIIRGMAYPDSGITFFANGANYETIKNYLKELDIAYARTLGGDNNLFQLPQDFYAWMPTAHHKNPKVLEYVDAFLALDIVSDGVYASARSSRLFYLWGHSYEFDRDDNWELIETICEKFSGKDDIWCATNMEIYEYITAYNALIYSADGNMVYNPTLTEVWFDVDGTLYVVKPGETISI